MLMLSRRQSPRLSFPPASGSAAYDSVVGEVCLVSFEVFRIGIEVVVDVDAVDVVALDDVHEDVVRSLLRRRLAGSIHCQPLSS